VAGAAPAGAAGAGFPGLRFAKEAVQAVLRNMLILVTYDVATVEKAGQRRLRRVAQACEDYGTRVQKSVFECQVGQKEWVSLRDRLLREIQADEDSLRFYFLDVEAMKRTEHHGVGKPVDLTAPLIL
jgi:CRISPR-associated protein Cas2